LPVVAPETAIGLVAALPVLVTPPLLDVQVAVLLVIGTPFAAPSVNDTLSGPVAVVVEPETAFTAVGAAGATATITAFDAADAGPVPTPLVAWTWQVYVLPSVRPLTTIGLLGPLATPVVPPLLDVQVAVKLVMGRPLVVPAVNGTLRPAPDRVTVPIVGALGTVAGMIAFEAADSGPDPIELVP
jgi:hypothetical protein